MISIIITTAIHLAPDLEKKLSYKTFFCSPKIFSCCNQNCQIKTYQENQTKEPALLNF